MRIDILELLIFYGILVARCSGSISDSEPGISDDPGYVKVELSRLITDE